MTGRQQVASVFAGLTAIASIVIASILYVFLPLSAARIGLTVACVAAGALATAVMYRTVLRIPNRRMFRVLAVALICLLAAIPIFSVYAQRVTYSRFGLTVYGAIPIPILDVTVDRHGFLWFRAKSHTITRDEIERLLSPEVDVVVVGIGWDSVARVTADAMELGTEVDLRVLSTPEALALYNSLQAEGLTVVLLAHSTC